MSDKNEDVKINKSSGQSHGKKIRIFTSFQQQEDEMIEYWASITPDQRLRHLYEMIKISFRLPEGDELHLHSSRTIKITSPLKL